MGRKPVGREGRLTCHSPTGLSSRFDRGRCDTEASASFKCRISNLYVLRGYAQSYRKSQKPKRNTVGLKRLLLILSLIPLLAGCGLLGFDSWAWHQKLTVTVETPQGVVSGSSIVAVEVTYQPEIIAHQGGFFKSTKGEAAFLEVRPGVYLFALLSDEAVRAERTFLPGGKPKNPRKDFAYLERLRETRALSGADYPHFVTFTDIADPSTVTRVDPDNLAVTFGPGYRLKSVTLEITGEPVTKGEVDKVLGWLGSETKLDYMWDALNYDQKSAVLGLRAPIRP